VTANLTKVTLRQAITTLANSARVKIQYEANAIDAYPQPVTLHVSDVTLGAALDLALSGTRLHVIVLPGPHLAVVEVADRTAAFGGDLSGRVTDAKTRRPLSGVNVMVDDSNHVARTDDNGRFRFANLSAGSHRLTVRSVGYARQTRVITVTDGQALSADFVLESSVNTLDQVVVTATGEQRYRELGHVVAKLNADSLVKNAPITSLAELLTARVPGLQVVTSNGGMAGGDVSLRLRGQTTTALDPQPIVIVDGVRYRSTNNFADNSGSAGAIGKDSRPFNVEPRSPLNDLNVNDIETVEVVKGPSASTLYGPDAANGVIVITTKRATAGKTEWHFYVHPRLNDITSGGNGNLPTRGYWAWGHDPVTGQTVNYSCTLVNVYYQQCVQDSITVAPTDASIGDLSVIAQNRPQWQSGADVSGGTDALRYFLSGGYDSQVGSLRIPPAAAEILKQRLGASALTDAVRNPNTQQMATLHSTLSATPMPKATVSLVSTYTQANQRSINAGVTYLNPSNHGTVRPGCVPDDPTCSIFSDDNLNSGGYIQTSTEQVQRLTGSVTGLLQATSWLTANATIGLDMDGTTDRGVRPAGSTYLYDGGEVTDARRDNLNRTATLNITANAHPGRLSFRTSLGTQYNYTRLDGITTDGQNLAPGSTTIGTATYVYTSQIWSEVVTLGTYGEEVLGLNDRLFLTGALRLDGSTSFGDAYRARPYPKVGVSWIASDEPFLRQMPGLSELRFRYSFGAASRYPTSFMKLGQVGANQDVIEGQRQNMYSRYILTNPDLRPERTRESEYGVDATLWSGTVMAGLTWHSRRTNSELQILSNPSGLPPQWVNVGDVAAHGFEATLETRLVDTRRLRATVQLAYSHQTDKLLSLGGLSPGGFDYRVGYPLSSAFGRPILGVADTVGGVQDSIVLSQEVIRDSVSRFFGVLIPPTTVVLTPAIAMFDGRVRISASLDRQTGFVVQQSDAYRYGLSLAPLLKTAPLMDQAMFQVSSPTFVPGDFTRWRELTVSTDIPQRLLRMALLSRGAVNFQVRNLGLWTRYHGSDPESLGGVGGAATSPGGMYTTGIPLARSWTISFDVTP